MPRHAHKSSHKNQGGRPRTSSTHERDDHGRFESDEDRRYSRASHEDDDDQRSGHGYQSRLENEDDDDDMLPSGMSESGDEDDGRHSSHRGRHHDEDRDRHVEAYRRGWEHGHAHASARGNRKRHGEDHRRHSGRGHH